MTKKIMDLTLQERLKICNRHIDRGCEGCPFSLELFRRGEGTYCVHHILNVLEREVSAD